MNQPQEVDEAIMLPLPPPPNDVRRHEIAQGWLMERLDVVETIRQQLEDEGLLKRSGGESGVIQIPTPSGEFTLIGPFQSSSVHTLDVQIT